MINPRKKYITNTEVEINYLQASKRADEEVLENLLHQTDCPYIQHQIQQITAKNIQRHETIQELTQKLQDLHEGKLDNEIKAEIILSTQQHENAEGAAKDKKIELKKEKKISYKKSSEFYLSMVKADRQHKYRNKDMQRALNYYHRTCDTIPDYIHRNLKEMPNNKGYIWRGIWCLGDLPAERNKPLTLFERRKNLLIISEFTTAEVRVYHKYGKDRKVLHSTEARRKIASTESSTFPLKIDKK